MSTDNLLLPSVASELDPLLERVLTLISNSKGSLTRAGYRRDFADYQQFCSAHNLVAAPATRLRVATIARRLAAIVDGLKSSGHDATPLRSFLAQQTWKGIKRTRDIALFLISFAGAFRRSESAGLNVEDLKFCREGVVCTLRRSKTDQEGAGREVGNPYAKDKTICPVRALKMWLKQAKITAGPVFRRVDRYGSVSRRRGLDPASVAYIVKQAARRASFRHVQDVSGHSFRSGHVSQAVRNGVPEYVVMKQTGHKSREVLGAYIRTGEMFEQNAASGLWAA